MARHLASPRSDSSQPEGQSSLAAIIGHELNNIAVPLDGFAELILESMAARDPARQNLDEMRIAIGRIKALAFELESLGESESVRARVAIVDCMSAGAAAIPGDPWQIEWRCKASTPVTVDVLQARRAVQSLALIATPALQNEIAATAQLTVELEVPPGGSCAACGRSTARKRESVCIYADGIRKLGGKALRDPFGRVPAGRLGRRLMLAVLVHCGHCAGGHVLLDEAAGRLALVFPTP